MSTTCGSTGLNARIAYDGSASADISNFTSADYAFALTGSTSLSYRQAVVNNQGTSGDTNQASEMSRAGLEIVEGNVSHLLSPELLEWAGPYITGRAYSSDVTYPAAAAPDSFHALLHRDERIYLYGDLKVNTMTISASSGEPVTCQLGLIGETRSTLADTSWPADLDVDRTVPYMFHDCAITIGGSSYIFRSFTLTHNNNLAPRYFGSTTPCDVYRAGLSETTLQLVGPHTSTTVTDLLEASAAPNVQNIVMTFTHTSGSMSTVFRMQGAQVNPQDPQIPGAGEILLDLTYTCRTVDGGASDGAAIILTNDSTP